MKALEIYEQDIIDREQDNPLPRQQYYAALRDALCRELMQQGYSDLLEQLLLDIRGGEMDRIYVIDYAALMECHSMIVLGREMRDASEYVPHLHLRGEKAQWSALEKPGVFLMPVKGDMVEKFKQLRAVSRQLVDARDNTVLPQADDAAQREIEQVHALNKMLDERCKALQAERDELQNRLRQLEEGVITEQVRYAIEARRIQEEEALRQTYEEQRAAAREAYRTQFAQEQSAARLRREEEQNELLGMRARAAEENLSLRFVMLDDLRHLSSQLEEKIAKWQQDILHHECKMLAQCYISLHNLWTQNLDQLILQAQCTGTDATVLASLADFHQQLDSRIRQMETALLRMGLVVFRPEKGEPYNPALHMITGAAGQRVARCITPGVMVQGARESLLRAEVELE